MSVDPLKSLGRWRAAEGALEITVPFMLVGYAWYQARGLFAAPTASRGLTPVELSVVLGACVALTGWMASRQMFIVRRRNPWSMVLLALVYTGALLFFLPGWVRDAFGTACTDTLQGLVVQTADLTRTELLGRADTGPALCKVGGVPDNPYLPGTLLRPSWYGELGVGQWGLLFGIATISTLGFRDRRLWPTALVVKLLALLRYAPARGHASGLGKPAPKEGKIVACNNATLWGEACGQIYPVERVWQSGEWCGRCSQPFRRAEREIQLKVVSLFSVDVDVLNGIERIDTVAWGRGDNDRGDARPSGLERWVHLGTISLPDVITVSQALSIIHDMLPIWGGAGSERIKNAATLATRKASRVSAWIWLGSLASRLTYARPNNRAWLAIGPMRLRDIIAEGGDEVWLQLDVGLLPLEMRYGGRKNPTEEGKPTLVQDYKSDVWIPVAPPNPPKDQIGLWVPRVEGDAIRTWLSTERLRDENEPGASIPLSYVPLRRKVDEEGEEATARRVYDSHTPRPGSLDFVRQPLDPDGEEPTGERNIGDSIAEWAWLEWEQIQLLRQQCLVLMERPEGGGRTRT